MKNGTRIFLICIIIVLLLGYVIGFVYCTVNKYASAEEIDNNSILNFNQQLNIKSVDSTYYGVSIQTKNNGFLFSGTSTAEGFVSLYNMSTAAGHKYYFYSTIPETLYNSISLYHHNGTTYDFNFNAAPKIITLNGDYSTLDCNIHNGYTFNDTYYFNLIDLTQMFGVELGNSLTLEQCQRIFTADYYNYTTGKPLTLSGIDQYNNALNDIFKNYKYMLDRNALSTQTQATNLMGTLSGDVRFGYNDENWYILGAMYCPLFTKISADSEFNIEIQLYAPSGRDNRYLCFGTYIDNELNEIYKTTHNGDGTTLNINFTTPIDVQTLYVYERNESTGDIQEMNYMVGIFNIRVEQLDIAGAVMSSYSSGYNTARDYYSEGGQGFADIFARGKAAGLIEANGSFTAMDYVKTAFITIGEILMIEVFPNFTLGAFFLLPLLTSTIFFIVKLTRGGS